jgi:hypothetical protein
VIFIQECLKGASMPRKKKYSSRQDLAKYRVLIDDTSENSKYFELAQIPEIITGGKSAFLVTGTDFLKKDSKVLVEIIDKDGFPVYTNPIPLYAEGLARIVSIEVYEDTPKGPATLTILGELSKLEDGTEIPAAWKGKYNVKYTKRILIDPKLPNVNKIRLYERPELIVTEQLIPHRNHTPSTEFTIESSSTLYGNSPWWGFNLPHTVNAAGVAVFNRYMAGGEFTASISALINEAEPGSSIKTFETRIFSSSIKEVKNQSQLVLDSPLAGQLWNQSEIYDGSIGVNFIALGQYRTDEWVIKYNSGSLQDNSRINRSFAVVDLQKLRTISGDIARAKIYMKSVDDWGGYEQIADFAIEANELTVTQSYTGSAEIRVGGIISQDFANQYWTADSINSASYYG